MLIRSLISHPVCIDRLKEIVQLDEDAQARLEKAAVRLGAAGRDCPTIGCRLRATRPILGALRRKHLQLIEARWRATATLSRPF